MFAAIYTRVHRSTPYACRYGLPTEEESMVGSVSCSVCGRPLSGSATVSRCTGCTLAPSKQAAVPADLYQRPDMRAALAAGDWATVLTTVIGTVGLSQTAIAARVGMSQPQISRLASGQTRDPGLRTIRALCDGLEIPRQLAGLADPQEETTDRRHFLATGLGVAAGATMVPAMTAKPADAEHALMLSSATYRRMEQLTPARMLTGPVRAHLTLTRQLADRAGGNDRSLHAVVAETAGLAAWLYADLAEAESARRYYRLAVTAARRSGHPLLPVYMQASLGQYAVGAGDPGPGLTLIRDAAARLPRSAPPIARAWLDVLEGVALAYLGNRDGMALLTRAERRVEAAPDSAPVWPWLMRFDAPKIAAYRATAAARLGLARTAISAYRVASAVSRSPKQEALATVEQAGVIASIGQLDEACALGVLSCEVGDAGGGGLAAEC
ncbi:helix-turn-helix domain-containing protein, partial [Actinocatenispora thailandica]|uniref:helix-turn-helix domain-containing protein n=1 Tax=Actinocatenispora thailandica TaxID=227318 RepID=UPI0031CF9BD8